MSLEFDDLAEEEFDEDERQLAPQDVARLLVEFKENLPELSEEDRVLFDSLFGLLDAASQVDMMRLEKSGGTLPWHKMLLMTLPPPRRKVIFATQRDNWVQTFDAPHLTAHGKDVVELISIRSNSDAGSRFDYELLGETGIRSVTLFQTGKIEATIFNWTKRELSGLEKLELADYLDMTTTSVSRRL